ncbi:MAG: 4'-phosphopantetheinyl transferase superfamily protein [Ginsengibacter sp.]
MNKYEPQWRPAIPGELIYPNQVHVWRTYLDLTKLQRERLLGILSTDEVERAGRFHFERHKERFIAARGILRLILGSYLGKNPHKLRFGYTNKGKPVLAINADYDALSFNLSHSDTYALYAVTKHRNIGIDIEHIRDDVAIGQIAQKFFSQGEIRSLEQIHKNKLHQLFFQYWTRKEALLKAIGEGISSPMELVDVSQISGAIILPGTLPGDEKGTRRWYVQDLFPGHNYAAAIAVEEVQCDLSYMHYSI